MARIRTDKTIRDKVLKLLLIGIVEAGIFYIILTLNN